MKIRNSFICVHLCSSVVNSAGKVRWVSALVIVVCLLLLLRRLPMERLVAALEEERTSWGNWGPVLFGLLYVALVVLLVPGSALTLAAGALFGRGLGTLVVSLASTTGAALAFLISRYLARQRVAAYVQHHPRLEAVDRAVSEGGWKIVALLRLSPLVPFNLQNYLYGVTGIRFWPYVLTSWLTMLPGTFLYVYLGSLGRQSLESIGAQRRRTPAEWTFLIVGLLATLTATLYLTRLARKALSQRGLSSNPQSALDNPQAEKAWPWGATLLAVAAVAAVSGMIVVELSATR
jgi:uncharacterized membrane protein YdjX (TVP38/TMEM64 family)